MGGSGGDAGGGAVLVGLLAVRAGDVARGGSFRGRGLPQGRRVEREGTYLLWIDCSGLGLSDEELADLVNRRARLWVDEGEMFGPGGEGVVRGNIGCPRSVLQTALSRLSLHA